MRQIWLTGDIHADPRRFNNENFPEQKDFDGEENYVIVLGDFGLVWALKESEEERWWLNWLNEKNYTTLFVDGNHENFERLATFPVKEWHGGKVHEIRPKVLHLMRGQVFDIGGSNFFSFGGASSHDIQDGILDFKDPDWKRKACELNVAGALYRTKGLDWWEQELPTQEEMDEGMQNLEKCGGKVDYVISHTPSTGVLREMEAKRLYSTDRLTDYLDVVRKTIEYKKWFFGHMHVDRQITEKDYCLYKQIVRLQ